MFEASFPREDKRGILFIYIYSFPSAETSQEGQNF